MLSLMVRQVPKDRKVDFVVEISNDGVTKLPLQRSAERPHTSSSPPTSTQRPAPSDVSHRLSTAETVVKAPCSISSSPSEGVQVARTRQPLSSRGPRPARHYHSDDTTSNLHDYTESGEDEEDDDEWDYIQEEITPEESASRPRRTVRPNTEKPRVVIRERRERAMRHEESIPPNPWPVRDYKYRAPPQVRSPYHLYPPYSYPYDPYNPFSPYPSSGTTAVPTPPVAMLPQKPHHSSHPR